jgi:ABC-type lipoprotein release transport system permease subunit
MFTLKMAFRNIFRQRRRSILTGLSMLGGFFMAALFIGFSDGSYDDIIDKFTRTRMGHIQIHEKTYLDRPSLYKTINNIPEIGVILESTKNVESWTPRLFSAGLVSVGDKTAGVQIIGIDPEKERQTTQFDSKILNGHSFSDIPSHEAIIGKGLAKILKASVEDEIVIISQASDGSIAEDLYRIVGILSSGDDIGDRTAFYLHLQDAQELLTLEDRVHEIAVTLTRLNKVVKTNKLIAERIDGDKLVSHTWQEFAKAFYSAMKADQEGMWIMLVIIVIIVAIGVLNTVLMSVLERRREYGLLKALGTKPKQIVKLVLLEVSILALISIILGTGLGLLSNSYLAAHGFNISNFYKGVEGITYGGIKFETMKSVVNFRSFIIPTVTIVLVAVFVGLFPALKAARTEPAKTMRMH